MPENGRTTRYTETYRLEEGTLNGVVHSHLVKREELCTGRRRFFVGWVALCLVVAFFTSDYNSHHGRSLVVSPEHYGSWDSPNGQKRDGCSVHSVREIRVSSLWGN